MALYPTVAAGQRITAALLQSMIPNVVVKSADQSIANDTSNQNDLHLFAPVEANASYIVEGMLLYAAHSSADIRMGWTVPAGATFDWIIHAQINTVTGGLATGGIVVDRQSAGNSAFPLGGFGAENTTVMTGLLRGRVETAGTAGTLQLNWAQLTANATASIMKARSWISLRRTS